MDRIWENVYWNVFCQEITTLRSHESQLLVCSQIENNCKKGNYCYPMVCCHLYKDPHKQVFLYSHVLRSGNTLSVGCGIKF